MPSLFLTRPSPGNLVLLRSSAGDWSLSSVVWIFSVAIVCLGLAAALGGKWLERVGPRYVGVVAATLWGRRVHHRLVRHFHPSALACLSWIWGFWRVRVRPWLCQSGIKPDTLVPRSARDGNRNGHYGIWRRRHDRGAPETMASESLSDSARLSGR